MADRKRGMGRGLAAILPESSEGGPELRELDVTQIEPNPDQPRAKFDANALDALAGSIGSVGLLQPLIVRPIGRSTLLLSRFLGAAVVCTAYVLIVYFAALAIVGVPLQWWPARVLTPGLELAAGVVIVIALSLLGSVALSSTANGIAVFMLFGAGLVAGLLGTIGQALNSGHIRHASTIVSWALPFEALYQDGLHLITESSSWLTGFLLRLGPFGGGYVHGWEIRVWALAYLLAVGAVALTGFARRDL